MASVAESRGSPMLGTPEDIVPVHQEFDLPASREQVALSGAAVRQANRLAVRESLVAALEITFEQWGRMWICSIILLIIGMIGVIIWSEMVYDSHRKDHCDQPLAHLLQALYIIVAVRVFQREIVKYVLCYSLSTDGPVPPGRVVVFRRLSLFAGLAWPVVGVVMLSQIHKGGCSPALEDAVIVLTGYYAVFAFVTVLLPAAFVSVMLVLLRRGCIRMPRDNNAAPEGFTDTLPVIPFEAALFDDETPGAYPSVCPVCLEAFDDEQPISKTPCPVGCHAFHTECLRGWLNCSKTCPLCRHDMTTPVTDALPDPEVGCVQAAA